MTQNEAEVLIARLDNLEARARDVEVGMTRIRRELQNAFRIKTWDYDPSIQGSALAASVRGERT